MKKVIFGITSLNIGGAEKVLVDLANELSSKYDITILTIYGNGDLSNKLNSKIKLISIFNKKYEEYNYIFRKIIGLLFSLNITLKFIYKKYIDQQYSTEIAFLEGPVTSLFSVSKHKNKYAWIHTNIFDHLKKNTKKIKKQYNTFKKIIFVSQNALEGFNKVLNNNVEKVVIYNYLNTKEIIKKADEYNINFNTNVPVFVSVCRLVKAKAIDRLALVSKKLIQDGYNHKVYVIGDGPERNIIEKIIEDNNLKDIFILEGYKENPFPHIKACNYFILPSLYEGYGMVLVEAMSLNKPIITTDTGAKEAVSNYKNKIIVNNNEEDIYLAMKKVITKEITFDMQSEYKYNDKENLDKIYELLEESV